MKRFATVVLAVSSIHAAYAGELADKKKWDAVQGVVDTAIQSAASDGNCGAKLTVKIDKGSFKNDEAMAVAGYCTSAVDGVGRTCASMADHKKDILAAVKTVTCRYDASLKADANHAVKVAKKGSNLEVSFNKDSANVAESVASFLEKEL